MISRQRKGATRERGALMRGARRRGTDVRDRTGGMRRQALTGTRA
jgi:hypothetical protein